MSTKRGIKFYLLIVSGERKKRNPQSGFRREYKYLTEEVISGMSNTIW
jgi:hypothetical protein